MFVGRNNHVQKEKEINSYEKNNVKLKEKENKSNEEFGRMKRKSNKKYFKIFNRWIATIL